MLTCRSMHGFAALQSIATCLQHVQRYLAEVMFLEPTPQGGTVNT